MSDEELVSFFLSEQFVICLIVARKIGGAIIPPDVSEEAEGVYDAMEERRVFVSDEDLARLLNE